jgi:hypothetical protein
MAQQSRLSRTQKASDNGHRDRGDRRRLVSRRHASLSISRVDIVVEMLVHVAGSARHDRVCSPPQS